MRSYINTYFLDPSKMTLHTFAALFVFSFFFFSSCTNNATTPRVKLKPKTFAPPFSMNQSPSPSEKQSDTEVQTIPTQTPLPLLTPKPIASKLPTPIYPPQPIVIPVSTSVFIPYPYNASSFAKCIETPLKTIEAYSLKPSLENISRLIGCGLDEEKTSPIESIVLLNLSRRLLNLFPESPESDGLLKKVSETLTIKAKNFPNLSEAILTFKKRDQVTKLFYEIVNRKKISTSLVSVTEFPAWKFEWKENIQILELQTWDQYYYKVLSEWNAARMTKESLSPKDFKTISTVTFHDVNRTRQLIQNGIPEPASDFPFKEKELDSSLQPIVPFRLMDEPTYFKIQKLNTSVRKTFSETKYSAIIMDLMLVNKFQEIQKELKEKYDVVGFTTMGTYNHRYKAGTTTFSRHAMGTAIDLSGVEWGDGQKTTILNAYSKTGKKELRDRLEKLRIFFKDHFDAALGPLQNKAHADHFHIDLAPEQRPLHYPLTSSFGTLVAQQSWVLLQNWYYKGSSLWSQLLQMGANQNDIMNSPQTEEEHDSFEFIKVGDLNFNQDLHESGCTD